MSNNGDPTNASFDSLLPDTPSPAVNPPAASSLTASSPATPATSPQRASASTSPCSDICSKKKEWRISDLTRSVDSMEIDPDTPPAVQSRSIVHPVAAADGFLDDVNVDDDEKPNIRFENHRTEKLDPSNVLGSAKRIIMNTKAEGANKAAITRVIIKMVTREDLLGWLTTKDPSQCPRPVHLYPNTSQWPIPPRTAKQKFQFVIAVHASPHYLNKMRHCAMSGYWNVDATGQAVSAKTFARDCLTDARNFYTHLDPASLHQPRPDQALINSTAINRFRNALTPEQWIQVEDRAQQLRFNFIEDIEQLIACARHMTSQKKLAPKPGGKAEPPAPAPTPATALTTASTPPAPAAHVHVIDAETPPAPPMKRAAPNDEGGCQNSKKFKGNGNNNNRKQDYRPQDRDRLPPRGNRSHSRDYDNRDRGGSSRRRSPSPRRQGCKRCGLDNHTARSCKYSGYTVARIKALTEEDERHNRQGDHDYRGSRDPDNRRDDRNRRFYRK
ncbi:hypothetical protein M427DRAFT_38135 [Gonapodya prolifera JEL478]|uniref:Uncharacterized protein n=1 Tax=Gonapodya prolifera (strain JEL478) TaxID=1344416 RepID=A0A138ZZE9_GONPJ|nr:hypothetical protein M427DRAFT_38135 [Gonapodya prolifera JEL478]|eukprot:KXS09886.1 hypothetical protein M427DRAFT_38135 [Gonapodya prolifera JEL478]